MIFIYVLDSGVEYLKITIIDRLGYMLLLPVDALLLRFVLQVFQFALYFKFRNHFLSVRIKLGHIHVDLNLILLLLC